uniref:START domain-containing protein n=1 Tax=viral metagenome TaxID=1070528 RepID=A0A6C0I8I8_9ZZZZ
MFYNNDDEKDKNKDYEKKITEGKNFLLVRVIPNNYRLTTTIENKDISVTDLLDFRLINLMYQTNLDKFEKIHTDILNENEATVFLRMTHFFKDFGLKQRYICFDIKRHINTDNTVLFILTQNASYGQQINDKPDVRLLPITHIVYEFKIVSSNKVNLTEYIHFDHNVEIPAFLEPLFGAIMKTMLKQTIRFIELLK